MKYDLIIGIDPDVKESGIGIWSTEHQKLSIISKSFWDLYSYFISTQVPFIKSPSKDSITLQLENKIFVRIEAGWLNKKSNYHTRPGQSKVIGERISAKVSANHQIGKLIGEMCEYLGIDYEFVPPMGKVTPEYFTKLTGIPVKKKDQDKIDAGMLVYQFNK